MIAAAFPRFRDHQVPLRKLCLCRRLDVSSKLFRCAPSSIARRRQLTPLEYSGQPDVGSARADFPGGSVSDLYESAQKLLALPDNTRIFSGHDYPGAGRSQCCSSTVAEQRAQNKHFKEGTLPEEFSRMRSDRDSGLSAPKLLHQSLQVNVRGGHLPR